jgi:hypothetical protein
MPIRPINPGIRESRELEAGNADSTPPVKRTGKRWRSVRSNST